jgi:ribonuclease HI
MNRGVKEWFYTGYFDAVTYSETHITGLGIVLVNPYEQVIHVDSFVVPEVGDTQESEYMALLWLLKCAVNRGIPMIKALGDNDTVTNSITQSPIKKKKYKFYQRAIWKELEYFRRWKVQWLASGTNPADDLSRALTRGWVSKPAGERQIELIERISRGGSGDAFGLGISRYPESARGKKINTNCDEPINHSAGFFSKPSAAVFERNGDR